RAVGLQGNEDRTVRRQSPLIPAIAPVCSRLAPLKYDVILIDCKGANLEHTGAIAGMSGSPIFLKDDAGRERMIGAFAYGWPMVKDPVAGVQPIEYMLELPQSPVGAEGAKNAATPKTRGASADGSAIGWAPLGGAWLPRFARHRAI